MATRYEIQRVQFLLQDWHPAIDALRESTGPEAIKFREKHATLLEHMDDLVYAFLADLKLLKKGKESKDG
jgi:hypothetical protein